MPANSLFSAPLSPQNPHQSPQIAAQIYSADTAVQAPTISLSGVNKYVENARPFVMAPGARFQVNDAQLAYGSLSIVISDNASPDDRVALRTSPTAINIVGSAIRYADHVIGSITHASGDQLIVRFNAQATQAEAQALIRSVTFRTLGDNPSPETRTIQFQFQDSSGLASNIAIKQMMVQPVNDMPRVDISGGQTFQAGQGPVVLAPNANLIDPDTADLAGGQLLVTIARNIQAGDVLSIRSEGTGPGQLAAANGRISFEGRQFATFSGGTKYNALSIRFLDGASHAAVEQLLRSIVFSTSGQPLNTWRRSITFEMSDHLAFDKRTYKVADGVSLNLGIAYPTDWKPTDQRPALVFAAGTWTSQGQNWWNERIAYFTSRGLVCIRVVTRVVPADSTLGPELPAEDFKSAMRWVRAHAAELGIDPNRIGTVGASAGGHLAAVSAMIDGLNDPNDDLSVSAKSNALLMFNGIVDTGPDDGWGYYRVKDRYKEFSPVENISPDDPPVFNVAGTEDKTMPTVAVRRFESLLQAAGIPTSFHYYDGMPHGFMNYTVNNGRYYYLTLLEADRFLASLGWLEGNPTFLRPAADRIGSGMALPWYAGMKTVSVNA